MEGISLARSNLPSQWFLTEPFRRRKFVPVRAKRETGGRDYGGRLVDENMIVLRMRIREMAMSDGSRVPPSGSWMEWEKKYYEHYYGEDVCEAVGLLQSVLMNTRPCLAIGMVALVGLCVPLSTCVLMIHAVEVTKGILRGFHLS